MLQSIIQKRLNNRTFVPSKKSARTSFLFASILLISVTVLNIVDNASVLGHLTQFSSAAAIAYFVIIALDFLLFLRDEKVTVSRTVPASMAVNRYTEAILTVHHSFSRSTTIQVFDGLPEGVLYNEMPTDIDLEKSKQSQVRYKLKPLNRGPLAIDECHVRTTSVFGFWNCQYRAGKRVEIKVYPDFSAISAYTIFATDNHVNQLGVKRKPKRGEGMDFHQLRDYRLGDSLRKIDWKATSRRNKLISKEYQEERDQQIVLMIDSGRRMRAKDDHLNHFDHSLNALLLVSYIGLRQGDNVSVMSFGQQPRWIPPKKGVGAMKAILNGMYDLHAGTNSPDYVSASEKLLTLQRKRSLVIIVTNTRDEEADELLAAVKLLRQRHVVILANIREEILDVMQDTEITNIDNALEYSGVQQYLNTRRQVHQKIINNGIYAIDCLAKELAIKVANAYLEIKRSGVL